MAQERLTMRKIAEVLRLKWECSLSNRGNRRSCSISHSTVAEYLQRAQQAGLRWPLPADMGETPCTSSFSPGCRHLIRVSFPARLVTRSHRGCAEECDLAPAVVEYREASPDVMGTASSVALYREWAKCLKPSIAFPKGWRRRSSSTMPDRRSPSLTRTPGEVHEAQIFIGVLAPATTPMRAQESRICPTGSAAHVRMFAFLGGAPDIVVRTMSRSGSSTQPVRA